MLEINITALFQFLNFIIIMVVLNRLLFRPLRAVLQKRRDEIGGSHQRAKSLSEEIQAKLSAYEIQLEEARKKATEVKNALRQEGLDQERSLVEEAQEAAQNRKESIRDQIATDAATAKMSLKDQVHALGMEISHKVLGRAV